MSNLVWYYLNCSELGQPLQQSSPKTHLHVVQHIFRYIQGTNTDFGLCYQRKNHYQNMFCYPVAPDKLLGFDNCFETSNSFHNDKALLPNISRCAAITFRKRQQGKLGRYFYQTIRPNLVQAPAQPSRTCTNNSFSYESQTSDLT